MLIRRKPVPPHTPHHPNPAGVLDLLLDERLLTRHLSRDQRDALSSTCRRLRHHHTVVGGYTDHQRACVRLLERQMTGGLREGPVFYRLLETHDRRTMGALQPLLEDCRDLIWAADAVASQGSVMDIARGNAMGHERRRVCLAYMYAAKYGQSVARGHNLIDQARYINRAELGHLLAMDIGTLTLFVGQAAAVGALGYLAYRHTAVAAAHAASVGTVKAKIASAGLCVMAGGAVVGSVGVLVALGIFAHNYREATQPLRDDVYQMPISRDSAVCEAITLRRRRQVRAERGA